jgi:hypothetical protein
MHGNLSVASLSLPSAIASVDPCLTLISLDPITHIVTPINAQAMDASIDLLPEGTPIPCPTISIPFTWNTYGNHVNSNNRWIGTIENFDFKIKTNSTLRMIVKNDGRVGIGTSTPTEMLEVNGNSRISGKLFVGSYKITAGPHTDAVFMVFGPALFSELYVTYNDWNDYVFDDDYKLPNIYTIENYYKTNKHLPEIPSEKEVIANGVNLGEINKILLKKIEELTLYIVQQQKDIDQIKKEMEIINK